MHDNQIVDYELSGDEKLVAALLFFAGMMKEIPGVQCKMTNIHADGHRSAAIVLDGCHWNDGKLVLMDVAS